MRRGRVVPEARARRSGRRSISPRIEVYRHSPKAKNRHRANASICSLRTWGENRASGKKPKTSPLAEVKVTAHAHGRAVADAVSDAKGRFRPRLPRSSASI